MPKISVIVPCYNVSEYLSRGLESLTKQTLKDIEIICIDDKSTDDTLKILESYSKKDSRIKLIKHSENQGVAVARNDGMKIAQGDYIGFIDPDDYVDLDFYEKLYKKAERTKSDVIKGNVKTIYHDGRIRFDNFEIKRIKKHLYNFASKFWSAIYKKDFLQKYKIFFPEDIRTGQDSVFLSKLVLCNPKISMVKSSFYHYFYQRPGSLDSVNLSHNKVLSRIGTLDYKLNLFKNADFSSYQDKKLFLRKHILDNFTYTFNKGFEEKSDQELLFKWLCNSEIQDSFLFDYFGENRGHAVLSKDYEKFSTYRKRLLFLTKEFLPNNRRRIYFCGFKVFEYKRS